MDSNYDIEKAAEALERIATARIKQSEKDGKRIQLATIDLNAHEIAGFEQPTAWRLSHFDQGTKGMEERTVRFQGIVCKKDLPPVNKVNRRNASDQQRRRRHMRQAVTITGLGTPSFDKGIKSLNEILLKFANTFPEDKLNAWQYDQFQNWPAIQCHARYFTEKKVAPEQPSFEFGKLVDPNNVLQDLMGRDFFHGPDNYVEYMESISKDGKIQYKATSPTNIRVGDIVDLELAFISIPVQDDRFKAIIALRGIALLNKKFRNDAMMSKLVPKTQILQAKPWKRRLAFEDEEVEEARERMQEMEIDRGEEETGTSHQAGVHWSFGMAIR